MLGIVVTVVLDVLRTPFGGFFMWPFAVAVLGGRYLTTSFSVIFGHPSRKPARMALSKVEIGGLHSDWCANLTAFVLQFMECVKLIVSVTGSVVSG